MIFERDRVKMWDMRSSDSQEHPDGSESPIVDAAGPSTPTSNLGKKPSCQRGLGKEGAVHRDFIQYQPESAAGVVPSRAGKRLKQRANQAVMLSESEVADSLSAWSIGQIEATLRELSAASSVKSFHSRGGKDSDRILVEIFTQRRRAKPVIVRRGGGGTEIDPIRGAEDDIRGGVVEWRPRDGRSSVGGRRHIVRLGRDQEVANEE
ncbi:hypothetical protein DFH09DRAFT_1416189 [Mycena vulgaris]|nr:hypothetical protein DFH09DRAFT_1416189 [Mycena vulgaris]